MAKRVEYTTEFIFEMISQDGNLLGGSALEEHSFTQQVREVSQADSEGYFKRLAAGEIVWHLADDGTAGAIEEIDRWQRQKDSPMEAGTFSSVGYQSSQ